MALGQNQSPDSQKNNALKTGPPLVGIVLNWWLFGILIMQYFMYCNRVASRDKKVLQVLVHFLFILDTVQTIMTMVDAFHWFIYNFGNYETFLDFGVQGIDSPVMDGIIAFVVQIVYCWRINILSGWRVLPAIIAFLALLGGVNGMVVGIYDRVARTIPNIKPSFYVSVMLWLWSSVATDILIAFSMTYLLLKLRSQPLSSNVMMTLKRLLIITLETNILTTAVALATVLVFLIPAAAPPLTSIHSAGGYIIGKLYTNSFMVLLNQRIYYENSAQNHAGTEELGTRFTSAIRTSDTVHSPVQINVNTSSVGEVSVMRFAEGPPQADIKTKPKLGDESYIELSPPKRTR